MVESLEEDDEFDLLSISFEKQCSIGFGATSTLNLARYQMKQENFQHKFDALAIELLATARNARATCLQ